MCKVFKYFVKCTVGVAHKQTFMRKYEYVKTIILQIALTKKSRNFCTIHSYVASKPRLNFD